MTDQIERTERVLGRVLTVGSHASTVVLGAGLALALTVPHAALTHWLLTIGLVTLIATPIARVAVSVVAFVREREWFFAVCTAIVLGLLVIGIIVAVRG